MCVGAFGGVFRGELPLPPRHPTIAFALFPDNALHRDAPAAGVPSVRQIRVTANDAGQRLDNFLASRLKGVPRTRLYRIIRRGEVRVNGGRSRPADRLEEGDMVRVPPVRIATPASEAPIPPALARPEDVVIYEDADLLVINKPAGIAVHGGSGIRVGVIEALKRSDKAGDFLELGHRLDRDTSGCLVLARSRPALIGLHRLFRRDEAGVVKRYTALLNGAWLDDRVRVDVPIQRYRDGATGQSRARVSDDGQISASIISKVESFSEATLVSVDLLTGRMHQARVHCRHLGFPILGDPVYGDFAANRRFREFGLQRLFLHASELAMPHPVSGRTMRFDAPLDPALARVLDAIRGPAGGTGDE